MTNDRSDTGASFAWDADVRNRVEERAAEIRRRRRVAFGGLSGVVVAIGVGILAATLMRSGPPGLRLATRAPDPSAELAGLLPTPPSVAEVLPQLHVRVVDGGRDYGVANATSAELLGAQGAELGVTRQWVGGTGSVQLQPGQPFPDEVQTVLGAVIRFDTAADAQAWTTQTVARAITPVQLPNAGVLRNNLVVLRGSGDIPGKFEYLAVFTDGDTAFSLSMIGGGSGSHDNQFVRLVQDWTRQMVPSPTPSTVRR